MSSKIIINNQTKQVTVNGVAINTSTALPTATEQGSVLVSDNSGAFISYTGPTFMRNRIINGDMRVAQRGTAAVGAESFPVDRWLYSYNAGGTITSQQSTFAPTGFSTSVGCSVSAGVSATAAQYGNFQQKIEGYNIADFAFGTAAAKTIAVSFWVRASIAGTYCVSILNWNDSANSNDRSYVSEYTISSINTWEKKTVIISGCTDGVWYTDNRKGMYIVFDLGSGTNVQTASKNSWVTGCFGRTSSQTNIIGTTGASFYLTGVQIEVGSAATPFEYRPIQYEIALCQRYYARLKTNGTDLFVAYGAGVCQSTTATTLYFTFPQVMRSSPTISQSNTCVTTNVTTTRFATTGFAGYYAADNSAVVYTTHTGLTAQAAVVWCANNSAASYVELNAEL